MKKDAMKPENQEENQEEREECIYCLQLIPLSQLGAVPQVDDDEQWSDLCAYHAKDCEWIRTRAHRF